MSSFGPACSSAMQAAASDYLVILFSAQSKRSCARAPLSRPAAPEARPYAPRRLSATSGGKPAGQRARARRKGPGKRKNTTTSALPSHSAAGLKSISRGPAGGQPHRAKLALEAPSSRRGPHGRRNRTAWARATRSPDFAGIRPPWGHSRTQRRILRGHPSEARGVRGLCFRGVLNPCMGARNLFPRSFKPLHGCAETVAEATQFGLTVASLRTLPS